MGLMKRLYEEMTESGMNLFSAQGKWVCSGCFRDYAIKQFIQDNADATECSFCEATGTEPVAASLVKVARFIHARLCHFYDDAAEWLPYETAEGGYQGSTYDTWDIISAEVELTNDDDSLFQVLVDSVGDRTWCDSKPYAPREHESLIWSWERFCNFVKHERRFFFMAGTPSYVNRRDDPDAYLSPSVLFQQIAEFCVRHEMVREVRTGTRLFRVRPEPLGERYERPLELGAPPPEFATTSNRMSPPGVSMTYLAEDLSTAVAETLKPDEDPRLAVFAMAEFELMRPLRVLDLEAVPATPSMFDESGDEYREELLFLRRFTRSLALPIARDNRVHVDYIPTQVVTELFRTGVGMQELMGLDGLRYPSVRRTGGHNIVLFLGRESLVLTDAELNQLSWSEREKHEERGGFLRLRSVQHGTPPVAG